MSCHGATFLDTETNAPAEMKVKVDTFTTARFGCPLTRYMFDPQTGSLFDEAHTYFIPKILKETSGLSPQRDKPAIRDIITRSLCHTRNKVGLFVQDTCRFMCHERGTQMAEISIMGPGSYMVEVVLSVDLNTGATKDVHENFGLELVLPHVTYPPTATDATMQFRTQIERAERDLAYLRANRQEYFRKYEFLKGAKESLKGAVKSSNYMYAPAYEDKYIPITYPNGHTYKMIKLSDVIQIAIDNGTINPETDFVIVQACRTFDGQLPPNYDGSISPGRLKGYISDGGRKRTITRTRMIAKNRNNRNKNKNKHKTTKKRKRKTIRRK
jgi:hypothetical protein